MISTTTKSKIKEVYDPLLFAKVTKARTLVITSLDDSFIDLPLIIEYFKRSMSRILILTTSRQLQEQLLAFLVRNEFSVVSHIVSQSLTDYQTPGIHLFTIHLFLQRVTERHLQECPFDLVFFWGVEKLGYLKENHPLRNLLPLLPSSRVVYSEGFSTERNVLRICQLLNLSEIYGQNNTPLKGDIKYVPLSGSYLSVLTALEQVEDEIRREVAQEGIPLPGKGRKALIALQQQLGRKYGDPQTGKALVFTAILIRINQLQEAVMNSGLIRAQEVFNQWEKQRNKTSIIKLLRYPKITLLKNLVERYPLPHPKIHIVKELLSTDENQQTVVLTTTEANAQTIHLSLKGKYNLLLPKNKASERQRVLDQYNQKNISIITTLAGLKYIQKTDCLICWQPIPSHKLEGFNGKKCLTLITKGTLEEGVYWRFQHQRKRLQQFVKDDVEVSVERLQEHREKSIDETDDYLDRFIPQSFDQKTQTTSLFNHLVATEGLVPFIQPLISDKKWKVEILKSSQKEIPYVICNTKDVFLVMRDEELIDYEDQLQDNIEGWQLQNKRVRVLCYSQSSILHQNKIIGKISKLTDEMGVSIIFQPIQLGLEFSDLVKELASQTNLSNLELNRSAVSETNRDDYFNIWINMLSGVPGINKRKATEILDYFGSLKRLMNEGTKEKLGKVRGIGDKLAQKLQEVLEFHESSK